MPITKFQLGHKYAYHLLLAQYHIPVVKPLLQFLFHFLSNHALFFKKKIKFDLYDKCCSHFQVKKKQMLSTINTHKGSGFHSHY